MPKISSSLLMLLLLLPLISGCELEAVPLVGSEAPAADSAASTQTSAITLAGAHAALSDQDYDLCATRFAAAARTSKGEESATCWYRASQCAARAGDYKSSRFHMRSAASAGFASLRKLRTDPLFRPLKSGSHWTLIDDLVKKNRLSARTEESALALCQVPDETEHAVRLGATL